jgi:hypothetical protein
MSIKNLSLLLSIVLGGAVIGTADGQVFYTEGFDYPDGDLEVVSGGIWAVHSGMGDPVQVVSGNAILNSPGSNDYNRLTGSTMGPTDVWYYGVTFSVNLGAGMPINNDYFIHLKDSGTTNFRARLATAAPADAANDYSLQIWASSFGDGMTAWNGDFSFDETLTCMVCWDNGTGTATLWVNPVDINSPNVSDDELPDAGNAHESVALRQDSTNSSQVVVDILAVGTDFDAVLAAVSGGKKCLLGDVNGDGDVDLLDVQPFVSQLTNGVYSCEADVNGDGEVDLLDVQPFVIILSGG